MTIGASRASVQIMLECAWRCVESHWPAAAVVASALLPSLVVGLTRHRRNGVGALAALVRVLDRLSVLSHRDAKGTLKAPGKASEPSP